jgi:hypothetical protein
MIKAKQVQNTLFFYLTALSLFFVTLFSIVPIKNIDLWYAQYLAYLCIIFLGISIRISRISIPMALFVFYASITTVFVTGLEPRSFFALATLSLSALGVDIVAGLSRKQHKIIIKCIFYLFLVQSLWVILQYFNLDPIFDSRYDKTLDDTVGFSGSHNQIGLFLAVTTPIVYYALPVALLLTLFGLFNSTTSIAVIGACASLFFYHFFTQGKYRHIILILAIAVSAFYVLKIDPITNAKFNERVRLWKHGIMAVEKEQIRPRYIMNNGQSIIRVVECNKWLGYGLQSFMSLSPFAQRDAGVTKFATPTPGHVYEHAHNDYVEAYFDLGRIGFALLMLFIIELFIKFLFAMKTRMLVLSMSCIVAFMTTVLAIYGVQTAVSGILLVTLLGIFYGELRRQHGPHSGVV